VPDLVHLARRLWRDPDLAVDLGSAVTKVCAPGALVVERQTSEVGSTVVRRGMVADVPLATRLLQPLLDRWHRFGRWRPRVIASHPVAVQGSGRERLVAAIRRAGASDVVTVPATVAAAIGAGLDVASPYAAMVIDIGAALTEMSVFRAGAVVRSGTIRVGTEDLASGRQPVARIASGVREFWSRLPIDVQVETLESGVTITGGGALAPPVRAAIEAATRLPLTASADPRHAVVHGLSALIGEQRQ
jgi:rod shape-determining protein MreB and related proteins